MRLTHSVFFCTSHIANEPIPPPVLMDLLKIDDKQKAEAQAKKSIPIARLDQLESAM